MYTLADTVITKRLYLIFLNEKNCLQEAIKLVIQLVLLIVTVFKSIQQHPTVLRGHDLIPKRKNCGEK